MSVVTEVLNPRLERSQVGGNRPESQEGVDANSQPTDGFTEVRGSRRCPGTPVDGGVLPAGGAGGTFGNISHSQLRKLDSRNISVSNKFGNLSDETIPEAITEEL